MADVTFLSPVSKLLRFFHSSRDNWKEKCKQAKLELKRLKQRLRKLESSRDRWKEKARQWRGESEQRETVAESQKA